MKMLLLFFALAGFFYELTAQEPGIYLTEDLMFPNQISLFFSPKLDDVGVRFSFGDSAYEISYTMVSGKIIFLGSPT
jgi:hypothetical protein